MYTPVGICFTTVVLEAENILRSADLMTLKVKFALIDAADMISCET